MRQKRTELPGGAILLNQMKIEAEFQDGPMAFPSSGMFQYTGGVKMVTVGGMSKHHLASMHLMPFFLHQAMAQAGKYGDISIENLDDETDLEQLEGVCRNATRAAFMAANFFGQEYSEIGQRIAESQNSEPE
jgi:hypothetical protein